MLDYITELEHPIQFSFEHLGLANSGYYIADTRGRWAEVHWKVRCGMLEEYVETYRPEGGPMSEYYRKVFRELKG